ncbi:cytochrome P450 76C3-like [Magnolia sinica]|uniref:cytochrome P450 76C3-like n=1 Tax=Magnolia sinica TaxID=86752 RepID=UPI002657C3A0|nr:cytochrome P450 76C3-like [Magnolia sinica]
MAHLSEGLAVTVLALGTSCYLFYVWLIKKPTKGMAPLPPGPPALPFIGNILSLRPDLHRHFAELASTYGPIMKLQLGSKLCIVVSSASVAKEVMRDHDPVFANRYETVAGKLFFYKGMEISLNSYGPEWRLLRKVFVRELLSPTVFESYYNLRRREVRQTVSDVYKKIGSPIGIRDQTFMTVVNTVLGMLWGGALEGEERSRTAAQFQHIMEGSVELLGETNVSDLFPGIAWLDLQGVKRKMKRLVSSLDKILESEIDQRLKMNRGDGEVNGKKKESKDFLESVLQLMEGGDPNTRLTTTQVKGLLLDALVASTHTESLAVEWTMAEMMQHPEVMRKVQVELEQVVGTNNTVEESHLPKLFYLEAVLKEVLRVHPVAPFLLSRRPSQSCTISGFTVPKGTQVIINAWAIHMDPETWVDPLEFQPERFLDPTRKWDYSGNDFCYIPFGSGRRICVGISLAEKTMMHVLASLLHSFEWRLPEGTELDLADKFGLLLSKVMPLVAIPTPRLSNPDLYY